MSAGSTNPSYDIRYIINTATLISSVIDNVAHLAFASGVSASINSASGGGSSSASTSGPSAASYPEGDYTYQNALDLFVATNAYRSTLGYSSLTYTTALETQAHGIVEICNPGVSATNFLAFPLSPTYTMT